MRSVAALLSAVVATATGNIPSKEIAPGVFMPLVGVGTWQYNSTVAYDAVCAAFSVGYNYVDTAQGYGNQDGVGRAIKDCWKKPRSELFVMTKIPGGLDAAETLAAHQDNLKLLQLDYVDHLMTHFPCDWDETPERCNKARRQEEWKALEKIHASGEAKSIGVSHYCPRHLEDIREIATIMPSVNQVEYHIGSQDIDGVIPYCQQHNITFQSFSPLCGPCNTTAQDNLVHGDLVTSLGKKYGVSGPQISLRYIVQQALEQDSPFGAVIPKSNKASHLANNIDLFSFALDESDMDLLKSQTTPAAFPGDCDAK